MKDIRMAVQEAGIELDYKRIVGVMFFRPKAARWLIDSGVKLIPSYKAACGAAGSARPEDDAVLMFMGFTHFALGYYVSAGKLGDNDVVAVLTAAAFNVRRYAAGHWHRTSYIQDTQTDMHAVLTLTGLDPVTWPSEYYARVRELMGATGVDEATFTRTLVLDSVGLVTHGPPT